MEVIDEKDISFVHYGIHFAVEHYVQLLFQVTVPNPGCGSSHVADYQRNANVMVMVMMVLFTDN